MRSLSLFLAAIDSKTAPAGFDLDQIVIETAHINSHQSVRAGLQGKGTRTGFEEKGDCPWTTVDPQRVCSASLAPQVPCFSRSPAAPAATAHREHRAPTRLRRCLPAL